MHSPAMRATECSFCQHNNPPDAKFCNACGAPLYLVSCPHCGALNDDKATACHQCSGKLQSPTERAAPPTPGARKAATAGSAASAKSMPDLVAFESLPDDELESEAKVLATLQQIRQLLERSDPDAAVDAPDRAKPDLPTAHQTSPAPQQTRVAVTDRPAPQRTYPVSAVAEPREFRGEPRTIRTVRRVRVTAVVGAVLLVGLAAAAYALYRWTADSPPAPTAGKTRDGGSPVATGTLVGPGGGSTAGASIVSTPTAAPEPTAALQPTAAPRPTAPPPTAAPQPAAATTTPAAGLPAVRPGTVSPADREAGPAPIARAPAASSRAGGDPKDAPGVAPPPPATVARPRAAEAAAGFELQQPRLGPCTEQVAALGLCAREPAQRRE